MIQRCDNCHKIIRNEAFTLFSSKDTENIIYLLCPKCGQNQKIRDRLIKENEEILTGMKQHKI